MHRANGFTDSISRESTENRYLEDDTSSKRAPISPIDLKTMKLPPLYQDITVDEDIEMTGIPHPDNAAELRRSPKRKYGDESTNGHSDPENTTFRQKRACAFKCPPARNLSKEGGSDDIRTLQVPIREAVPDLSHKASTHHAGAIPDILRSREGAQLDDRFTSDNSKIDHKTAIINTDTSHLPYQCSPRRFFRQLEAAYNGSSNDFRQQTEAKF